MGQMQITNVFQPLFIFLLWLVACFAISDIIRADPFIFGTPGRRMKKGELSNEFEVLNARLVDRATRSRSRPSPVLSCIGKSPVESGRWYKISDIMRSSAIANEVGFNKSQMAEIYVFSESELERILF